MVAVFLWFLATDRCPCVHALPAFRYLGTQFRFLAPVCRPIRAFPQNSACVIHFDDTVAQFRLWCQWHRRFRLRSALHGDASFTKDPGLFLGFACSLSCFPTVCNLLCLVDHRLFGSSSPVLAMSIPDAWACGRLSPWSQITCWFVLLCSLFDLLCCHHGL